MSYALGNTEESSPRLMLAMVQGPKITMDLETRARGVEAEVELRSARNSLEQL